MTHEEIKSLLSAYFDAQLDAERTVEISAHIAACAECRGALDRMKLLSAGAKENLSARAPAAMKERVLRSLAGKRRRHIVSPAAVAAVITVIVFTLVAGATLKHYIPELWATIQGKIGGAAESLGAGERKR